MAGTDGKDNRLLGTKESEAAVQSNNDYLKSFSQQTESTLAKKDGHNVIRTQTDSKIPKIEQSYSCKLNAPDQTRKTRSSPRSND